MRVPHTEKLSPTIHVTFNPAHPYDIRPLPNGAEEIVFATFPAQFQLTVSYLYFHPIDYRQINLPIYSDEGKARVITVLPQQQLPRWITATGLVLITIGFFTVIYLLFLLGRWGWSFWA